MSLLDHWINILATLIEFGGALLVVFGCTRGLLHLAVGFGSRESIDAARLIVADGIVAALGFKTAATLLKTIELRSWQAILMFVAVFALRTFVKQALMREEAGLRAKRSAN
ncbi:hypothetical protein GOFOIKOB_4496 [Methylobacterium tardum]|uniref:DUF1622 domain-containing protein n=1 Tax=Methylobacterium tardum TaxID=374432 RepID=A0AA37TT03_9HYPH|nr:DUF1622 domain-containing protein [Methylobacterium tardum]URD39477.1 DUF1622 domain-containing protein [Methylobacterium tardum]GJE51437.1 hypothetical protein GOFOIKOB_4496 [Methylobacterium tardum]GLS73668.1 hypothetical protein GCM10007890_56830 [Methylobacterium tardum]